MKTDDPAETIQSLLDRLTRLNAADEWNGPLNPSQFAALAYLARANRFSRAPSQVADYLATTRGTASQTLKALARKHLIDEERVELDKRSIRYRVTDEGSAILDTQPSIAEAAKELPNDVSEALAQGLTLLLQSTLKRRNGRSFGICRSCRHHLQKAEGPFCTLLTVPLTPAEAGQICHEHQA